MYFLNAINLMRRSQTLVFFYSCKIKSINLLDAKYYGMFHRCFSIHELERLILSYGESVKVMAPLTLQNGIKERLNLNLEMY